MIRSALALLLALTLVISMAVSVAHATRMGGAMAMAAMNHDVPLHDATMSGCCGQDQGKAAADAACQLACATFAAVSLVGVLQPELALRPSVHAILTASLTEGRDPGLPDRPPNRHVSSA